MNVYLETLGCQMNRLDSQLVVATLAAAGHRMTDDRRTADVILYNTCSVRAHAENKVHSRLGADCRRKAHHRPDLLIGVLGCMAQREGEQLRNRYPLLDMVIGPGQLPQLGPLLADAAAGRARVAVDPGRDEPRDRSLEMAMDRLDRDRPVEHTQSPFQAFVRVMRGCDNFCTYCIVPFVRGPEVSRPPADIVSECRRLIDAGRHEITLLGQTVNRYRYNEAGRTVRFADLLAKVAELPGLGRLRFVTSHPLEFTDDILQAMRDLPTVCEYMHVPAQSGSDPVLERMNRKYTRSQYDELIDRARQTVPDIALAGDFIVGFPGETEDDHQASAELIRRSGYKNSFVFKYSPRPGTLAAQRLADDVPAEVKKRRNNELLDVQAEVGLAHHRDYVGRSVEVLVAGPSPRADKQPAPPPEGQTQLLGRTRGDHIVVFDGPEDLAGRYVTVTITDATALTLFARFDPR
jgi:tRNA-2-methylthio-N6-dimethylallyladenosine synthase